VPAVNRSARAVLLVIRSRHRIWLDQGADEREPSGLPHVNKICAIVFAVTGLAVLASAAEPLPTSEPVPPSQPWQSSAVNVETGLLWQFGHNTPLAYRLVPTQLSWRSREFMGHAFADGSRLVARHRFTLIGTWVQQGPESFYTGFSGSPSIEWWNAKGSFSLFCGAGGGCGVIDSRGKPGGQGEDYTLNWFGRAGVEWLFNGHNRVTAGAMFMHMSNGGRTDPNPGIDSVGFTAGWALSF
jgi:lipid A 3-O-deacylase